MEFAGRQQEHGIFDDGFERSSNVVRFGDEAEMAEEAGANRKTVRQSEPDLRTGACVLAEIREIF
jgi:hypothetical protein